MLILRVEKLWTRLSWESWPIPSVSYSLALRFIQPPMTIGMLNLFTRQELTLRNLKMLLWPIMKSEKAPKVAVKFCSWDTALLLKDIWSLITMKPSTMCPNGKCCWPRERTQTLIWTRNSKNLSRSLIFRTSAWSKQMRNTSSSAKKLTERMLKTRKQLMIILSL